MISSRVHKSVQYAHEKLESGFHSAVEGVELLLAVYYQNGFKVFFKELVIFIAETDTKLLGKLLLFSPCDLHNRGRGVALVYFGHIGVKKFADKISHCYISFQEFRKIRRRSRRHQRVELSPAREVQRRSLWSPSAVGEIPLPAPAGA